MIKLTKRSMWSHPGLTPIVIFSVFLTVVAHAADDKRPNILLIVADDLAYTDIGAFGGEIETPNLDALAQGGLRMTNFHSAPTCAPARAMLMTGVDHHAAGMGSQPGFATEQQRRSKYYQNKLLPEVPTIAEQLAATGYRAVASAKWHLGAEDGHLPNQRGFDRSFVLLQGGGGHFDTTPLLEAHGQARWLEDDKPVSLPEDFYSSDYMTAKILEYIDQTPSGQPWFAYVGYTAPHWPLQAPQASIAKYKNHYLDGWDVLREKRHNGAIKAGMVPIDSKIVDFEPGVRKWDSLTETEQQKQTKIMQVYAAMVDRMDENIGRILTRLEQKGELDRTVIVFISDNGGEGHDMEQVPMLAPWISKSFDNSVDSIGTRNSYVSLGPSWTRAAIPVFRGSKSKISEGGTRVPAIVKLPGGRTGVESGFMRIVDLPATFLELAGGVAEGIMGQSLLSNWEQGTQIYNEQVVVSAEAFGRRMARKGHWKALLQPAPYGTGEWQLFNLTEDLGEQRDISTSHPEIRDELVQAYEAFAETEGVIDPEQPLPL
jgi:arylsulfatase A-like enzyme